MISVGSVPDQFIINEFPPDGFGGAPGQGAYGRGYNNIRGRTEVSSIVEDRPNTKIVIVDGQSEMATAGGTETYAPASDQAHNLNIYDGGIYSSADPVLGASYAPSVGPSSVVIRLADYLIAQEAAARVIMVPIAIGGTPWGIYDPSVSGSLFSRVKAAILRLRALRLEPDFIITARGATDNTLGTSAASIRSSVWAWADGVRALGCAAPIYLGKYTMASGGVAPAIQQGIDDAIDEGRNIRIGYDGDTNLTVAGGYRLPDQTHLSNAGLAAAAAGWGDILIAA